jgi:hypothetical protein
MCPPDFYTMLPQFSRGSMKTFLAYRKKKEKVNEGEQK